MKLSSVYVIFTWLQFPISCCHGNLMTMPCEGVCDMSVMITFCHQWFPKYRSYSTLSVGSTRSSLMSDLQDTPKAPSVISNSEQPPISDLLVSDTSMVRSSSPTEPDDRLKNLPPVIVPTGDGSQPSTVEGVAEVQRSDNNAGEGIAVAEVNDEEFGQLISVSTVSSDSRTAGAQVGSIQPSDETQVTGQEDGVIQHNTKAEADTSESSHPAALGVTGRPQVENPPDQISSLSESTVMPADSSVHPEWKDNIGNSVDGSLLSNQSPLKGVRDGKASNRSPEVDKLSLKKKAASKTGKKMSKNQKSKEKGRKSRGKAEAVIDDNQSEISYQPDTDLSRSKASKKVNSKFCSRLMTLHLLLSFLQHDLLSKHFLIQ